MAYQGGKQKIGKRIYSTLLELEKRYTDIQLDYLEPFMGFCGVLKHFSSNSNRTCYATDANPDIVEMWRAILNGWQPSGSFTREDYYRLKNSQPSPERTLYGHTCAYGGNFFRGYLSNRDYASSAGRSINKIKDQIQNVNILDACSYEQHEPNNMLVYCDPPYLNNKICNTYFSNFDHDTFWSTMRVWSKNNLVVVSEYTAPDDFDCVWEMNRAARCMKSVDYMLQPNRRIEKLFVHKDTFIDLT